MRDQPWQVEKHCAVLRTDTLKATLDARFPGRGLTSVTPLDGSALTGYILAVDGHFGAGDEAVIPNEIYCRGNDLIVGYEEFGQNLQTQAYWRARAGVDPESVDLQVSVHTSVLDDRPALLTSTCLPPGDMLRLKDHRGQHFEAVDLSGNKTVVLLPEEGEGCLLWRWPGKTYSYAEMIHRDDFCRDELSTVGGPEPMCRVVHHLFPGAIEKGVILRARVRGMFVDRLDDESLIAAAYSNFVKEAPPLAV